MGKYVPYNDLKIGYVPWAKKPEWAWQSYSGGEIRPHVYKPVTEIVPEDTSKIKKIRPEVSVRKPAKLGNPGESRRSEYQYKVNYGIWPKPKLRTRLSGLEQATAITPELKQKLEEYKRAKASLARMKQEYQAALTVRHRIIEAMSLKKYKPEQINDYINDLNKILAEMKEKIDTAQEAVDKVEVEIKKQGLGAVLAWIALIALAVAATAVATGFGPNLSKSVEDKLIDARNRGVISEGEYLRDMAEYRRNLEAKPPLIGLDISKYILYPLVGIGLYFVLVQSGLLKSIIERPRRPKIEKKYYVTPQKRRMTSQKEGMTSREKEFAKIYDADYTLK